MNTIWTPAWENVQGTKYLVLHERLRKDIEAGVLGSGDKLPPVRDLAWRLGVTPGTVARAYQKGVDDGFLTAAVGRGTFVADISRDAPAVESGDLDPVNLRSMRTPDVGQEMIFKSILQEMSKRPVLRFSQYPCTDDDIPLKRSLSDWMQHTSLHSDPGDIVLSHGAQNGLIMAISACITGRKPVVLCEEMAYFGVGQAAELLRVDLVGVTIDDEGIVPEELERACRETGASVLLTSSNVQNPTTIQTSQRRRVAIAAIAKRYDLQIIDDDCWGNEPADAESYRSLCQERYWYVSSLTKVVAAGLRFGWVLCPPGRANQTTRVAQAMYHGVARPVADIALELLRGGHADKIRTQVLQIIADRVERATNILGQHDIRWRKNVPYVWLSLPRGWRPSNFALHCERQKILIRASDEFTLRGAAPKNAVRISLNANLPLDIYEGALQQISKLLSNPPLENQT